MDPAAPAGPDLAAHRGGDRDGRGAATLVFFPEHQRAGRLLGRGVHRGRRAAGPGRAHPGPSGQHARLGGGRHRRRTRPRPGQQMVLNDPFAGGTHLNDITLVAPCHVDGRIVGWVANRAHHADVGGMVPGSIPPAATEIYQEGLRIPPVLLTRRGGGRARGQLPDPGRAARRPRSPGRGQPGRRRAVGRPCVAGSTVPDRVLRRGARLRGAADARRARPTLPDGSWEVSDVLDSTGTGGQRPRRHPPAADRLRVRRHLRLQPAPTPQQPGNVNAVAGGDGQRRGLGAAQRHRPDHPGQRRRPAAGPGDRPGRLGGRRPGPRPRSAPATWR